MDFCFYLKNFSRAWINQNKKKLVKSQQLKIDVYSRTSFIQPNIEFIANLSFIWDSWPYLDVIGAVFGDSSLNENYVEAESCEIKPIYTYKEDRGNIYIKCKICKL